MHLPALPFLRAWPLAVALCVPACTTSLPAVAARTPPLVGLEVVERDNATVLPQYLHRGQAWVPGTPGQRYALRLHNRGPRRVLAVVSVDGINVVDGRTAGPRQAGYVLGPWETLEIDGWRKSLDAVAGFVFVDPAASYAARTGRPANVGTIGIAVFRERRDVPRPYGPARIGGADTEAAAGPATHDAAPAPAAAAAYARRAPAPGEGRHTGDHSHLGTGHGRIERAPAFHTRFLRQDRPAQVTELRYDTRSALLARGIHIDPLPSWHGHRPRAFPGSGFVPDPP